MFKCKFYIIVFLFLYMQLYAAQDYKILSSNSTSLVVEYTPLSVKTTKVEESFSVYQKVDFANAFLPPEIGYGLPQLQIREFNVGVPSENGNTIQVLATEYSTLQGKILPVPFPVKKESGYIDEYQIKDEYSNISEGELVTFGPSGLIRDLHVQTVRIHPIQFTASTNKIKIYNKIVFRINFSAAKGEVTDLPGKFLENAVINFNTSKHWAANKNSVSKSQSTIQNSVLAQGTWYRFETPVEGIYIIDAPTLNALGIDPAAVDPRTIKIYSNGGFQLSENINAGRPVDLVENAITIVGETDGQFNEGDYILFYGRSTDFWYYDEALAKVRRNKHFYSKQNYYWITSGGVNGKRMQGLTSLNEASAFKQLNTNRYLSFEEDKLNIWKSGRLHVGDEYTISNKSNTYINTLSNLVPNTTINYNYQFIDFSQKSVPFTIEENGVTIVSKNLRGGSPPYGLGRPNFGTAQYSGNLPQNRSVLKFTFNTSTPSINGYIDYFEIEYKSQLKAVSDQLIFYSRDTSAVIEYNVSNFSNSSIVLFDISDYSNVKQVTGAEISGGQIKFQANQSSGNMSKYIACTSSRFNLPVNPLKIENSNIRGIAAGAQMIVLTHKNFKEQAERYRNYRSNESPFKLSVQIIYIDEVLDEFSGGLMDPTAVRDFLKYAYDNWQIKPFYLLLFGDGSYDYFNLEGYNNNFIPTYQTVESLHDVDAYPTDDYFARVSGDDEFIDYAHGRLNVNTQDEARIIVDKIIDYENNLENGLWRNRITLVADDGPAAVGVDDRALHTVQSERLSNQIIPQFFDQLKIYLAAFPTVNTGSGRRKPDVNKAIIEAVNNGTMILNYIGHGNRKTWAHERVFERETTIPLFNNPDYFFLTAATCNFGQYDDPGIPSATEEMLFLENKGMIGGFSASRPVYSGQNAQLNEAFFNNLFAVKDSVNSALRIGNAYFLTKQSSLGISTNSEKFHIFCDPALKLAEPRLPVSIDSINNQNLNVDVQVNALGKMNIDGSVVKNDGSSMNNFNGEGIVSVFDSERIVDLKALNDSPERRRMVVQGGVIFRGRVTVTNGKFSTNFSVPKDISYENKNGKVVAYVFDDNTDGVGFTKNIIVGGTDSTVVNDGKGPEIEIYFDDESSVNSYLVNPDFTLLVKLNDETGLNTTGTGVGHKLEGILNKDEENPIDFTNFFIGDLDAGGKSGVVKYKLSSMPKGDYTIGVKAWDVFNNPSFDESFFTVVNNNDLVLRDVVNYPNPFSSNTTFTFQHNYSSPINVKIKVYTIAGRLIKEIEEFNIPDKFVKVDWDGRDADGSMIANGTYLYKLIVESSDGNFKENMLGKMAVIR